MASSITFIQGRTPRTGALTQITATFLCIGLGYAGLAPSNFHMFWSGIVGLASVPIVVLALRGQPLRRTALMVFLPSGLIGIGLHHLGHEQIALLATPGTLWLMCLVIGLWSPERKTRLVEKPGQCGACGYDLTGNISRDCPECGEAAGPVVVVSAWWWRALLTLLLWLVGGAVGVTVFGYLAYKVLSQPI